MIEKKFISWTYQKSLSIFCEEFRLIKNNKNIFIFSIFFFEILIWYGWVNREWITGALFKAFRNNDFRNRAHSNLTIALWPLKHVFWKFYLEFILNVFRKDPWTGTGSGPGFRWDVPTREPWEFRVPGLVRVENF